MEDGYTYSEAVKNIVVKDVADVEDIAKEVDFVFSAVNMGKEEIKAIEAMQKQKHLLFQTTVHTDGHRCSYGYSRNQPRTLCCHRRSEKETWN